jgi:hypothetical protein
MKLNNIIFKLKHKNLTSSDQCLGRLKEVNKLESFINKHYKEMLKQERRGEVEFHRGINRISEDVNTEFHPKVIELLESKIEYRFRDAILLKFLISSLFAFLIPWAVGQLLQDEIIPSISSGKNSDVHYLVSGIVFLFTFYFSWMPNYQSHQLKRILKYALILSRYPGNDDIIDS